jgi:hypothetical protein
MDAEALAGFNWIFQQWIGQVLSTLMYVSPLIKAIGDPSQKLLGAGLYLMAALLFWRWAQVGLSRALAGTVVITFLVVWGLQPTSFRAEGRAELPLYRMQDLVLRVGLTIQRFYGDALTAALQHQTAGGRILPTMQAIDDAVERSASIYGDSDLSRLIRDYNNQCKPSGDVQPEELAAYHSIGLLGGGGLGLPESSVDTTAQLTEAGKSLLFPYRLYQAISNGSALDGAYSVSPGGLVDGVKNVANLREINSRRQAGLAALALEGRGFSSTKGVYFLPTEANWKAAMVDVGADVKRDFLSVSEAPEVARHAAYTFSDGREPRAFQPKTCVEAYHVAQFAAEQYYRALESTGKTTNAAANDTASTAIGAAVAWQRVMGRTMNGGELSDGGAAGAASGFLSAFQAGKTTWKFLELQTLLPFAITGSAIGFAMVLIFGPIFLLASLLMGVRAIGSWLAATMFLVFFAVFAQAIAVAGSFVMAGSAANQAAMASGWIGNGAGDDMLRAGISAVFGVLLAAAGWMATKLTSITMSSVADAARSSVTTAGDAAAMSLKAVAATTAVGRLGQLGRATGSAAQVRPMNMPHPPPVSGTSRSSGGLSSSVGPSSPVGSSSPVVSNDVLRASGYSLVPKRGTQTGSSGDALKQANDKKMKAQAGFERLRRKIDKQQGD